MKNSEVLFPQFYILHFTFLINRPMVSAHRLTHHIWQRQGFWGEVGWLALTPLSLGFSALVRARNLFYDQGWLPVERPPFKVISVGNLTVGGTGKTPMVL